MKLIINIIIMLFFTLNVYADTEKKDCSKFKIFSKNHITCKAHNLKNGTKNTAFKIKQKTGNLLKSTTRIFKKDK